MATTSQRLLFHLTDGALRRWSLWNEEDIGEDMKPEAQKHRLFQNWKRNPMVDGNPHFMSMFDNWPYWLVIDLCRCVFTLPSQYELLLSEPENLLEAIVDEADIQFGAHEKSSPSELFT